MGSLPEDPPVLCPSSIPVMVRRQAIALVVVCLIWYGSCGPIAPADNIQDELSEGVRNFLPMIAVYQEESANQVLNREKRAVISDPNNFIKGAEVVHHDVPWATDPSASKNIRKRAVGMDIYKGPSRQRDTEYDEMLRLFTMFVENLKNEGQETTLVRHLLMHALYYTTASEDGSLRESLKMLMTRFKQVYDEALKEMTESSSEEDADDDLGSLSLSDSSDYLFEDDEDAAAQDYMLKLSQFVKPRPTRRERRHKKKCSLSKRFFRTVFKMMQKLLK